MAFRVIRADGRAKRFPALGAFSFRPASRNEGAGHMVVPAQRFTVHECPHESEHQSGGRDQIAEGAPKRLPRGWKLPLPVADLKTEKQQSGGRTSERREGSKISGDEEDRGEGQDGEIEGRIRNMSAGNPEDQAEKRSA